MEYQYFIDSAYAVMRVVGLCAITLPLSYVMARKLLQWGYTNPLVSKVLSWVRSYTIHTPMLMMLLIIHWVMLPFIFNQIPESDTLNSVTLNSVREGSYWVSGFLTMLVYTIMAQLEFLRATFTAINPNVIKNAEACGVDSSDMFKHYINPILTQKNGSNYKKEFATCVKDTSILSFIGFNDIMNVSSQYASVAYEHPFYFSMANITYIIVIALLVKLLSFIWKDKEEKFEWSKKHD